eukprot:4320499-Pleurochrysis_carterae.AAC.3
MHGGAGPSYSAAASSSGSTNTALTTTEAVDLSPPLSLPPSSRKRPDRPVPIMNPLKREDISERTGAQSYMLILRTATSRHIAHAGRPPNHSIVNTCDCTFPAHEIHFSGSMGGLKAAALLCAYRGHVEADQTYMSVEEKRANEAAERQRKIANPTPKEAADRAVLKAQKEWQDALLEKEQCMVRKRLGVAIKMPTLSRPLSANYVTINIEGESRTSAQYAQP